MFITMKISNYYATKRIMCKKCGGEFDCIKCECINPDCTHSVPCVEISVADGAILAKWASEESVCHGVEMKPAEFEICEGWECSICGHTIIDQESIRY